MATTRNRSRIEALDDVERPAAWRKAGTLSPGDVIYRWGRWSTVERVEPSEYLVGGVHVLAGVSSMHMHFDEVVIIPGGES